METTSYHDTTRRQRRRQNLKRLLQPKQIAFIGGQAVEDSITVCLRAGYTGEIWPVNPKYDTLAGIPCYKSVADLPMAPDAALLAVSRKRTVDMIRQLAECGAGGAVSVTGEFAESDEEGVQLQVELNHVAGDLALVGPNCMGILNMFDHVAVWGGDNCFTPAPERGLALISQSGYVAYSITNVEEAFPLGVAISMGNQAVLDVSDFIDVLLDDERVTAIGIYLEGLVDVAALSVAALRAFEKGIPIVVLKAGGTQQSAQLTMSHSGTLAVTNDLWRALFERLGIVEVKSPKALVETMKLLGILERPCGHRLVAAANSGGYSALIAEQGQRFGLEFPVPTEAQRTALHERLPDLVSLSNPLDYNLTWKSLWDPKASEEGLRCLLDERCDMLVYFIDYPHLPAVAAVWRPTIDGLIKLNAQTDTPIVIASVLPAGLPTELRNELHAVGIPALQGLDQTMAAIHTAVTYAKLRTEILTDSAKRAQRRVPPPSAAPTTTVMLNEWAAKQRLAEFGLPIPRGMIGSMSEIVESATSTGSLRQGSGQAGQVGQAGQAETLQYPLVAKLLNSHLAHKNRAGAVRLNLQSPHDLQLALMAIRDSVHHYDPELDSTHFLIEEQVQNARAEFLVGVKRETGLGLALVIGSGGIDVERLRDYQTLLLPVTDQQIMTALGKLRLTAHLQLDCAALNALLKSIRSIARFAEQHRTQLVELDVNPLLLCDNNETIAVDALIRIGK
ncbi:MAG: acetate--CoA ligase family protein [Ardenticatenaceae bacterium]